MFTITHDIRERFASKIRPVKTCHYYIGDRSIRGDLIFFADGRNHVPRRVAYYLHYGIDPGKKKIINSCNNSRCINPEHLKLADSASKPKKETDVTQADIEEIRSRHSSVPDWVIARDYAIEVSEVRKIRKRAPKLAEVDQWRSTPTKERD